MTPIPPPPGNPYEPSSDSPDPGSFTEMSNSAPLPPMSPVPPAPPLPAAPVPASGPLPHPVGTTRRPSTRGRFAATVLAGALVLGGGAGVGGAAAYSALHDHDGGGAAGAAGTVTTSPVVATTGEPDDAGAIARAAAAVLPSVVKLDVSGSQQAGSGSGIILSSDGEILTNNHVAEVAGTDGRITVSFNDGSHAAAHIVGTDPLTDTAVIRAEGVSGLTPATIGSSDGLTVGQGVVAIGSPFGLNATVTSGIVSALDRPVDVGSDGRGNTTTYPAIQTDAAINPGNSGGPLVDLQGHVIGINSSIRSTGGGQAPGAEAGSIGLGFAIPIDQVWPVVSQLRDGETPTHARLGISVQDVSTGSGALVADGARVEQVTTGSAAGAAGLRNGDVVTKVDDHLITSADSLVATVRSYRPGDKVTVTYERDGREATTRLTLGSDADPTS